MEVFPPYKVKVVKISEKGMGVIATEDIKNGETIEVCPIVFISKAEALFFETEETPLKFYYLQLEDESERSCLMLGYGSLYNHSLNPNAEVDYNEEKSERVIYFKAIKDIKAGEEIVYDYDFDDNVAEFLKQE